MADQGHIIQKRLDIRRPCLTVLLRAEPGIHDKERLVLQRPCWTILHRADKGHMIKKMLILQIPTGQFYLELTRDT